MSDEKTPPKNTFNPMLKPRIEKIIVNMSVGKSGDPLEKRAQSSSN